MKNEMKEKPNAPFRQHIFPKCWTSRVVARFLTTSNLYLKQIFKISVRPRLISIILKQRKYRKNIYEKIILQNFTSLSKICICVLTQMIVFLNISYENKMKSQLRIYLPICQKRQERKEKNKPFLLWVLFRPCHQIIETDEQLLESYQKTRMHQVNSLPFACGRVTLLFKTDSCRGMLKNLGKYK